MEIIGHQKIWQFLEKSAENQSLSHAYLFSGQEHLGKKTLALEFIKFINCREKGSVDKAKNWHPDLILIDNNGEESIQISQIRKIQHFLSQTSFLGSYKSVIIDHAERMTKDAQSCLLKTLEEPRGKTLLILITPFPDLLVKTITSRCQKVHFFSVPSQVLAKFLNDKKLSSKEKERLIFSFRGRPGKLINFLLNPEKLEKENQILKEILNLSKKDLYSRFQYVKSLESKNVLISEVVKILTEYFRKLLLGHSKENYSLSKLKEILEFLNEVYFLISFTNVNKKLALEILMMKL